MSTLVYFGSGTDIWPIQRYAYLLRTFIYVDGLPGSQYYGPGTFGAVLNTMAGFVTEFKNLLAAGDFQIASSEERESVITIKTTQEIVIKLFLNTLDHLAWDNAELRSYLDRAETLYVKGYIPTIPRLLPA